MKKMIILIMFVLTISLFLMKYSVASHQYFLDCVYHEKYEDNSYTIQLPHTILNNDSQTIVNKIEQVLDSYDGDIYIVKSSDSEYIKYYYIHDNGEYNNINEQFDDSFELEIKPLSKMIDDNYSIEGEVILRVDNASKYNELKMQLENELSITINEITVSDGQVDMMLWITLSIIAFYLILSCILIYDLLNKYKFFSICKLNGYSSITIWFDYIKDVMLKQFMITFIGCYALTIIMCRRVNRYVLEFLYDSSQALLIILVFTLIICSIIIYWFTKVKPIDYIKNKSISHSFMILNQGILLALIVIIVILTSTGLTDGYAIVCRFVNYNEWLETKQYYILSDITNVSNDEMFSSEDYLNAQKSLFVEFNKLGSILADFNEYDNDTVNEDSQAYVNVNYIKKHKIKDINNHVIDINENETKRVVLVPKSTKYTETEVLEKVSSMYDISRGVKIIYYKDHTKFFTYNSLIQQNYTNMIEDPIVEVITESNGIGNDYDFVMGYKYNPYKIKGSVKQIKEILTKYDMSKYIKKYMTAYDEMSQLNHNEVIVFIGIAIAFITVFILMITIISENIEIYMNSHIKLIAIKTMNGYRVFDKYYKLIYMTIITYVLSFIGMIFFYPIDYLIGMYSVLVMIWLIILRNKIIKYENKSVVFMLKGSE